MEPPRPEQRKIVDEHAVRSADLLVQMGVTDATWLEAVREHHNKTPGPLQPRSPPAAAMQASYFDESKAIDDAGAALIKAVGVYSPGSFVRLANHEIGVVVRRGLNAATPKVAVLVNREGMPTLENSTRDTSQPAFHIVASVSQRDVKIKINLERLMPLTLPAASDRPW